jgi:hypothetical protein
LIEILIQLIWGSANESRLFYRFIIDEKLKLAGVLELFAVTDIPITSRSPNHQLHCSASAQISSLFYLLAGDCQECLNYLQSHPRHSNHFSKSQSQRAQLKFIQDQLFVLFL